MGHRSCSHRNIVGSKLKHDMKPDYTHTYTHGRTMNTAREYGIRIFIENLIGRLQLLKSE
jgi:hypothetical protein